MPIEPYHLYRRDAADPSESADQHIARELLQAENERLRGELRRAEGALRAAGKLLQPYLVTK